MDGCKVQFNQTKSEFCFNCIKTCLTILYYTQNEYKTELKDLGLRCPQKIHFFQRDLLRSCHWAVGWEPVADRTFEWQVYEQQPTIPVYFTFKWEFEWTFSCNCLILWCFHSVCWAGHPPEAAYVTHPEEKHEAKDQVRDVWDKHRLITWSYILWICGGDVHESFLPFNRSVSAESSSLSISLARVN